MALAAIRQQTIVIRFQRRDTTTRMILLLLSLFVVTKIEGAVLDPSLYLLPSPPLISNEPPVWAAASRVTRDADAHTHTAETKTTTTEQSESMESAETFWPSRTSSYGLGGVHIPLTFSVSGTYGNSGYGSGVVGSGYGTGLLGYGASVASSYASISGEEPAKFGNYGKSALAGSSYGTYGAGYPGIRLFGGSSKPGWSGWGNGKWGHYGKG